jgi:hypothetical protein
VHEIIVTLREIQGLSGIAPLAWFWYDYKGFILAAIFQLVGCWKEVKNATVAFSG